MNIRQLFYFCAAARLGSFSHAASELGVSVQAVSKALSELEEELGEPLFFRGSTGSQLTTFGEALFPYAEKATVSFKRTKEFADTITNSSSKRPKADLVLIIGAPLFFSHERFCLGLEKFLSLHLQCNVRVSMRYQSEALLALKDNLCDALITIGNFSDDDCDTTPIGKVSTAAFFSKNHPLNDKKFVSIKDLSQYPVINSSAIAGFFEVVTGAYRRCGLTSPELMVLSEEEYQDATLNNNAYALGIAVSAFGIPGLSEMHQIDPDEVVSVSISRAILKDTHTPALDKLDAFFTSKSFNFQNLLRI